MPKSHRPYLSEFRQRIVELVRKGPRPDELARQFEPSAQCIRAWVRQADRDAGQRQGGLTTAEQEEVRRLRRENRALRGWGPELLTYFSFPRPNGRRCAPPTPSSG